MEVEVIFTPANQIPTSKNKGKKNTNMPNVEEQAEFCGGAPAAKCEEANECRLLKITSNI